MRLLPLLTLLLMLAPGCRNSCQAMCKEIYKYANDSCGRDFTKDQLAACYDNMAAGNLTREDRKACRQNDDVTDWWDCTDIEKYFVNENAGDGTDTAATDTWYTSD